MPEDIKYTDKNKGTYVHPTGEVDEISPVSNPNGNLYLDESHRDMSDESFRPSFSNLQNTYMFSANGHKARERFWGSQYAKDFSYRNSNGDIEDPIFTGFTLSIDKLNSPLFYTIGQYDGIASDRETEDDRNSVRNLADEIENCLRNNYSSLIRSTANSYDITAILTKDKYPNNSEIGYGMQHNVYVDGLPYGATEYIYMVDKQVKDIGSAQDKGGHYSLGDGSKTIAAKDTVSKEELEENASLLSGQMTDLQDYLNDETNIRNHREIENEKNRAEDELKRIDSEISRINREIKALENQSFNSNKEAFETVIRKKLDELTRNIDNAVIDLKPTGNRSSHSLEKYNEICNRINTLDMQLQTLISVYNGNPTNVQSLLPSVNSSKIKVTSCRIITPEVTDASSYLTLPVDGGGVFDGSDAYKKGGKYKNIQIVVNVEVEDADVSATITDLKRQLENLETRERELRKKVQEATTKYENDPYSLRQIDLENVRNDLTDVNRSLGLLDDDSEILTNGSQTASPDAQLHTGDVYGGVEDDQTYQNRNKSTLPRAPQTVYDMLGFIRGMTRLTTEYPYLMQSITGLDEAYKNNYGPKDSFRGSTDNKISITIYESLDLKVSGMFNRYFNAVYDAQYRRERVPVNLRRFNCSVFVHDIRNFHLMTTELGKIIRKNSNKNIPKIVEIALNTMSAVEFKFFGCEIIPEETGSIFDNVSNAERGDMRMTNFTFSYSDCVINYLPFEDMKRRLLGRLKRGIHSPYVSVNRGVKKDLKDLKYPAGDKLYKMTSDKFDARKPRLNGLSNVNDNNRVVKGAETNIEFSGELEGLDGHSTVPQQSPKAPETLAEKMSYMLSSPLGNVNLNDTIGKNIQPNIDEPHLKGINSSSKDNMVASIGNVNENDEFEKKPEGNYSIPQTSQLYGINSKLKEGVYSKLGNVNDNDFMENKPEGNYREYETVRHSFFDNSPLGNVNNDDLEEYSRLRIARDRRVEIKDKHITGAAELNSLESVNENIEQSRKEFDFLFRHLATGVGASIGRGSENVYDAYLSEIEHVVFPGYNTSVIGNINYNPTPDSANNIVTLNEPQLSGIDSVIRSGIVRSIGDVDDNDNLEPQPNVPNQVVQVDGTNTIVTNGIVTELGDVLDDDPQNGFVANLGDVIPNDVPLPNVTNLGNVYPNMRTPRTQGYIGDVLPDDPSVPPVSGLGNIYPTVPTPPTEGYIGDVLPDDPSVPNTTNIGNIYPTISTPRTQRYIGDVIPNDPNVPNVSSIGNIYPTVPTPPTQGYIDDVMPDEQLNPNTTQIGNIYPNVSTPSTQGYIGDVIQDDPNTPPVESIGNIYPPQDPFVYPTRLGDVTPDEELPPNVRSIGNIYPTISNTNTQEYIGDVIPDERPRRNVDSIDNVYPTNEQSGRNVERLGRVNQDETIGENVESLDNVYPEDNQNGKNIEGLGKVNQDEKIGNILTKLGKLSEQRIKRKTIDDLGKV